MTTYLIRALQKEIGTRAHSTLRQRIGVSLVLIGAVLAVGESLAWVGEQLADPRIMQALGGGMLGAAATALGALPLLWARPFTSRSQGMLLGFAAGIMLAASAFSLILPSLREGTALWGADTALGATVLGVLIGAAAVLLLERALPHSHDPAEGAQHNGRTRQQIWLFVIAVTLHNLPEGLAIGVSAASAAPGSQALAFGIAMQDIPEGMAIAMALASAGYRPLTAVLTGAASGLVEPIAALFGAVAVTTSATILPVALAMAAGAMLLVTARDILPEALRLGSRITASSALLVGFVLMTLLDTLL